LDGVVPCGEGGGADEGGELLGELTGVLLFGRGIVVGWVRFFGFHYLELEFEAPGDEAVELCVSVAWVGGVSPWGGVD
jgi:hypothetical protein